MDRDAPCSGHLLGQNRLEAVGSGEAPADRAPPVCTVALSAVSWDLTAWGEIEEQQVGHQGHSQQYGLQFQAHPQENRARDEAQDAAAGVVLRVGTMCCQSPGVG